MTTSTLENVSHVTPNRFSNIPVGIRLSSSTHIEMIQSTTSLILIWVTSLIEGTEPKLNNEKRLCFLQNKFYHPQSGECQDPLEQGPCDQTQWLVPSTQDKMVLECWQRQETQESVVFIMKSNGDVVTSPVVFYSPYLSYLPMQK